MSRKRKTPNRKRGGRYTPPAQSRRTGSSPTARPSAAGGAGNPFGLAGMFGSGDDDEAETDPRYPVTVDLALYGPWTVPHAFARWLEGVGLVDEFDAFITDRRERGVHGDAMTAFLEGRDDVPADVGDAVDGYADYMDELFGPPA